MNIFILDLDPKLAAQYHSDEHVGKMILESAQLLSSAHRVLDGKETVKLSKDNRRIKTWLLDDEREDVLYKSTHVNHPCAVWVRKSKGNYLWLYELYIHLIVENHKRRGKIHKSGELAKILFNPPSNILDKGLTDFALAMPDEFKTSDAVESYRNYYRIGKSSLLSYKNTEKPEWL